MERHKSQCCARGRQLRKLTNVVVEINFWLPEFSFIQSCVNLMRSFWWDEIVILLHMFGKMSHLYLPTWWQVIGIVSINCPQFHFYIMASPLFVLSLFYNLKFTNYDFQRVEILVCNWMDIQAVNRSSIRFFYSWIVPLISLSMLL